jgi:hypothetical protein
VNVINTSMMPYVTITVRFPFPSSSECMIIGIATFKHETGLHPFLMQAVKGA